MENSTLVVERPDLKGDQAEGLVHLNRFTDGTDQRMSVLSGYAGTGKTFLLGKFIEDHIKTKQTPILVTAPTNKAVKVLKSSVRIDNAFVAYSTIHSALALKEHIDYNGKVTFRADKMAHEIPIESYNFVIVDETSMLSDYLFMELRLHVQRGLKVLFVGDPKQIPPVGQQDALPFLEDKRNEEGMGYFNLMQIVRQANGNPIIDVTMAIRERPNYRKSCKNLCEEAGIPLPRSIANGAEGAFFIDTEEEGSGDILHHFLNEKFNSSDFKLDADFMKIIAWRNVTVNYFNDYVRKMIYGEEVGKLVVGEKMIANTPIIGDEMNKIIMPTNEEFEVERFEIKTYDNKTDFVCKYYSVDVVCTRIDGTPRHLSIPIIHEDYEEAHRKHSEDLKQKAVSSRRGSIEAGKNWIAYYAFLRIFADVKYNYAITAHKSQGSTYDNCVVMDYDISLNNKVQERNRIKYTSCSRASKVLLIVV